jgi:hypothetical protein
MRPDGLFDRVAITPANLLDVTGREFGRVQHSDDISHWSGNRT